jgi:hypothetical protein
MCLMYSEVTNVFISISWFTILILVDNCFCSCYIFHMCDFATTVNVLGVSGDNR